MVSVSISVKEGGVASAPVGLREGGVAFRRPHKHMTVCNTDIRKRKHAFTKTYQTLLFTRLASSQDGV